jgi:hypothetical protein
VTPARAIALLAATALAVFLLHLLKPRAQRTVVASTLLWASVLRERKRSEKLWRWWLSLLLCLIAALAIGLALTQPHLPASESDARLVIVLDNSPSMAARTRDGGTRFSHALAEARALLAGAHFRAMLLDTMGRAPVSGVTSPAEARALLDRFQVVSFGQAQMPALPRDAGLNVHVISDGVAAFTVPAAAVVHSVFEAADNVAVTAFEVRALPADRLRLEAFVQLYNASPGRKHTRLALHGAQGFKLEQDFDLAPGELIDASFDVSTFNGGVLAAGALTPGDAFTLDDLAFAMVPRHATREIVLVTRGNARLEGCLRSLPAVRVRTIAPPQYSAALAPDAFVFDAFAPSEAPPVSALLFHPPPVHWLPAAKREASHVSVADWDRGETLTDGVAWGDLRIRRATLTGAAHPVVSAADGVLIARGSAKAAWLMVGFSPQESNLPMQTGFPVFVGNALDWLIDAEPSPIHGIGMVHSSLFDATVTDGSGARVASRNTPEGTVFEAARPDVYTLRAQSQTRKVVANLIDTRVADINHSRFANRPASAAAPVSVKRQPADPWAMLLWVAAALLLAEWAAYTRRITL